MLIHPLPSQRWSRSSRRPSPATSSASSSPNPTQLHRAICSWKSATKRAVSSCCSSFACRSRAPDRLFLPPPSLWPFPRTPAFRFVPVLALFLKCASLMSREKQGRHSRSHRPLAGRGGPGSLGFTLLRERGQSRVVDPPDLCEPQQSGGSVNQQWLGARVGSRRAHRTTKRPAGTSTFPARRLDHRVRSQTISDGVWRSVTPRWKLRHIT